MKKTQYAFMHGASNRFFCGTKDLDRINGDEPNITPQLWDHMNQKSITLGKIRTNKNLNSKIPETYQYLNESKFKNNLVGNCSELSSYAFHNFIKYHSLELFNFYKNLNPKSRNLTYIIIYNSNEPYDHSFVNIYHMTDQVRNTFNQETLLYIQPDSWILDPWANIICRGNDYPHVWKTRMREWYDNNIFVVSDEIKNYNEITIDRYNKIFSPLRDKIYNIINPDVKFNISSAVFINHTGNIETISDNEQITYNIGEISKEDLIATGFHNITKINIDDIQNNKNYHPAVHNNLSDITTEKLIEKARIRRGLVKIALGKKC
ncbi:hypothetical protein ID853_01950 [Xenorhabdus sp. Vera]|uniref:hypothetical protein n=1 Tax=Xenorhabdus koppenhoeferi TaxID=351659 RepID=UPI0019B2BCB4|nr:hypothetical protein [Xenorhabdus sp. Vera]MBD2809677.1 hypothetical protein [Xenorhabdus sp. Vera]